MVIFTSTQSSNPAAYSSFRNSQLGHNGGSPSMATCNSDVDSCGLHDRLKRVLHGFRAFLVPKRLSKPNKYNLTSDVTTSKRTPCSFGIRMSKSSSSSSDGRIAKRRPRISKNDFKRTSNVNFNKRHSRSSTASGMSTMQTSVPKKKSCERIYTIVDCRKQVEELEGVEKNITRKQVQVTAVRRRLDNNIGRRQCTSISTAPERAIQTTKKTSSEEQPKKSKLSRSSNSTAKVVQTLKNCQEVSSNCCATDDRKSLCLVGAQLSSTSSCPSDEYQCLSTVGTSSECMFGSSSSEIIPFVNIGGSRPSMLTSDGLRRSIQSSGGGGQPTSLLRSSKLQKVTSKETHNVMPSKSVISETNEIKNSNNGKLNSRSTDRNSSNQTVPIAEPTNQMGTIDIGLKSSKSLERRHSNLMTPINKSKIIAKIAKDSSSPVNVKNNGSRESSCNYNSANINQDHEECRLENGVTSKSTSKHDALESEEDLNDSLDQSELTSVKNSPVSSDHEGVVVIGVGTDAQLDIQLAEVSNKLKSYYSNNFDHKHHECKDKLKALIDLLKEIFKNLQDLLKVSDLSDKVDDSVVRRLLEAQRELIALEDLMWKLRDASENHGYSCGIKESLEDMAVTLYCLRQMHHRQDVLIEEILITRHANNELTKIVDALRATLAVGRPRLVLDDRQLNNQVDGTVNDVENTVTLEASEETIESYTPPLDPPCRPPPQLSASISNILDISDNSPSSQDCSLANIGTDDQLSLCSTSTLYNDGRNRSSTSVCSARINCSFSAIIFMSAAVILYAIGTILYRFLFRSDCDYSSSSHHWNAGCDRQSTHGGFPWNLFSLCGTRWTLPPPI